LPSRKIIHRKALQRFGVEPVLKQMRAAQDAFHPIGVLDELRPWLVDNAFFVGADGLAIIAVRIERTFCCGGQGCSHPIPLLRLIAVIE